MNAVLGGSLSQSQIQALLTAALFSLAYLLSLIFYRLFWSPLSGVPGPKLAAATFWYEFYYDVIKDGQYTWKIQALHKRYGPIIRINPYELHIDDPDYYDKLYVGAATRRTDKWSWTSGAFNTPASVASTVPHGLHRRRRAALSNHFSASAVHKLEPLLRFNISKLLLRFKEAAHLEGPISLSHAYSALTADIITSYSFDRSWNLLDKPDLGMYIYDLLMVTGPAVPLRKQFPWTNNLARLLPSALTNYFMSSYGPIMMQMKDWRAQIQEVKAIKTARDEGPSKPKSDQEDTKSSHRTVFYDLLDANVPESEKSVERLTQEAGVLVMAGTGTTAHTLDTMTFHLLRQPLLLARLADELQQAKKAMALETKNAELQMEDVPLKTLETLPYLTAVIREGLRMSFGVPHRLQRISPDTALQYGDFVIPPGTPVSMSALLIHENEDLFPDPETFRPERWLPLDSAGQALAKYLVPFSRGSRACIGMTLAYAELYLTMAAVFDSPLRMSLYDTDFERDIKTTRDYFAPAPSKLSQGLRVTLR